MSAYALFTMKSLEHIPGNECVCPTACVENIWPRKPFRRDLLASIVCAVKTRVMLGHIVMKRVVTSDGTTHIQSLHTIVTTHKKFVLQ